MVSELYGTAYRTVVYEWGRGDCRGSVREMMSVVQNEGIKEIVNNREDVVYLVKGE